jgi:hypothetical protein
MSIRFYLEYCSIFPKKNKNKIYYLTFIYLQYVGIKFWAVFSEITDSCIELI